MSTTDKIRQPTNDKLAEVHDRLVAAIEDLVSGEDWRAFLEASQRLHTYSASNVLLIITQFPGATRVGGYRTWKGLGYQVRRGEKGIAVLAPIVTRRRRLDDHEEDDHEDNNQPEVVRILRGFRVVHVFDISQCDGPPWPEVAPTPLSGDAPAALWDGLAAQVQTAGFTLRRGDCGGANGRTDFVARTVCVRDDVESLQAVKTLSHELAHVLLHDGVEAISRRDLAEVEAESVAYLVCHSAGLASDDYSLPYVARWSAGDPAQVRLTAERVITTARRILDTAGLGALAEEVVPA
jgi:antirestriction protein ArdC